MGRFLTGFLVIDLIYCCPFCLELRFLDLECESIQQFWQVSPQMAAPWRLGCFVRSGQQIVGYF